MATRNLGIHNILMVNRGFHSKDSLVSISIVGAFKLLNGVNISSPPKSTTPSPNASAFMNEEGEAYTTEEGEDIITEEIV